MASFFFEAFSPTDPFPDYMLSKAVSNQNQAEIKL